MKQAILNSMGMGAVLIAMACARIEPDETGVLTKKIGPGKGIVTADQGPGYHRFLWPLDGWHRFPSTVQSIRFAHRGSADGADSREPIELTSADGDRVMITAEVLFRIRDGEAHKVLQDSGGGQRYRDVARVLTQDAARALFGRLKTEGFYSVARREQLRGELVALLRERMAARHLELVDFCLGTLEFGPNYEALIQTKKVADQKVELEKAKSRAAEEQGKVAMVRTQTDIRLGVMQKEADIAMMKARTDIELSIAELNAETAKLVTQRAADGSLHRGLKEAEGTRLMKASEAESVRLRSEALVGEGGRNLVALEMVKGLNIPEMAISSEGYPWLSPREMVRRFGGDYDVGERNDATP